MDAPRNKNAREKVYEFVKDRIMEGKYSPGETLNERDIATLTNVSRTPAREAFKKLEHEGLVSYPAKGGYVVRKYSLKELEALHRMLERLEALSVEMAAPMLTKGDFKNLENLVNRARVFAKEMKYKEYFALNYEFHMYFAKKTGSKDLLEIISMLRTRLYRLHNLSVIMYGGPLKYMEDHVKIIEALKGKPGKKPEEAVVNHIEHARKAFTEFYKKFSPKE